MNGEEKGKDLYKMGIRCRLTNPNSERSRLLDEVCGVSGLSRKSLHRLIHGNLAHPPRRQQRRKASAPDVLRLIRTIAQSQDDPPQGE